MSDLSLESEEKIPFDSEPIDRNKHSDYYKYIKEQNKQNKQNSTKKKNKTFFALVALSVLVFIMGIALIGMNSRVTRLKNARTDYTMNISSTGEDAYPVAKGMLSTVCVSASSTNNCTDATAFFSSSMSSRGSGVIYEVDKSHGDAYIITNYHVVSNTTTNKVFAYRWILLWDSIKPIKASYVGGSSIYDIAVLKVENAEEIKRSSCVGVSLGESKDICIGEEVFAIGNSMARNLRVTTGVVAVEEDLMGTTSYNMYISHSADVNSGNSGGGLYNSCGSLIGIVNAKFRDVNPTSGALMYSEVVHGMNYAIPVDLAVSIARNIIRNNGTLLRPALGLTLGDSYSYADKTYSITQEGKGYTTYQLEIEEPIGKFWVNDELVSITYTYNDSEITTKLDRLFALESSLFDINRGDTIEVVVLRGGIEVELTISVNSVTSVS